MRTLLDKLLVCAYLAIATLPVIGIWWSIGQRTKLEGVTERPKRPALTMSSFVSERYQHGFVGWFEHRLGFKAASIRVDNTLLFHAFRETKPGSRVQIGTDDVLFETDDLSYLGLRDQAAERGARAGALADAVVRIQRTLAARGRGFVPIIVPSKTSVYRDRVPRRWRSSTAEPSASDELVYRALVRAFDERGVRYVDGRALAQALVRDESRELIWGPEARHWSNYAACRAMQRVLSEYAALTSTAVIPQPCRGAMAPQPIDHVDHDLWRLLNASGVEHVPSVAVVAPPPPTSPSDPAPRRPTVLLVGTSFSLRWRDDAERSQVFSNVVVNYYDRTFFLPSDTGIGIGAHAEVKPDTDAWREIVLERDLIVLELLETYMLSSGAYDASFVDAVATELAPTP
jgi:hypothetical protein